MGTKQVGVLPGQQLVNEQMTERCKAVRYVAMPAVGQKARENWYGGLKPC